MGLDIKIIKDSHGINLVELKGPIDTETYQGLEDKLAEIIGGTTRAIIFDMAGVDYVSSIGIRVLISAKKSMDTAKARFAMVNLQSQVKKVFDTMKITSLFNVFNDIPEAQKYVNDTSV